MTMMATSVAVAKRIEVRMVYSYLGEMDDRDGNPYPLMIGGAVEHLKGIEDLLYLCAVSDWEAESNDADKSFASPHTFIDNVHVRRISYASPLEVVVWFFAGTTAATTAANRLINVWKNFQSARLVTAKTDLWLTAANVLQSTIDAPIPVNSTNTGFDRFQSAAQVIATLGDLEVLEEA